MYIVALWHVVHCLWLMIKTIRLTIKLIRFVNWFLTKFNSHWE